jgi:hypothetical protein
MKPILAILIVSSLASARAQQEPIIPAQPLPPAAPKRIEKRFEKTVEDSLGPALDLAGEAAANGLRVAQRAVAAAAKDAAAAARDAEVQLQDLHNTFVTTSGTSRGNRSLVITTSEPDPVANANAEEDLAIMSRILRKAVGSSQDERRVRPMGIDVDGSVFGSASGARNIYLDGYGAIFLLTVRYPLIGAPEKPDESKAKDTTSDEWKEAQQEELQSRPGGYGGASGGFGQTWSWTSTSGPAEDFDAEKVEKLKTSLLESLKNAMHIRALKPNDFVTIVVQGAEATRTESVKRKPTTAAVGRANISVTSSPADSDNKPVGRAAVATIPTKGLRTRSGLGETVMTIRVKKSDADAFAQGKLDLDAFRKKAAIQTYFRRTDSTTASAFLPTVR